MQSVRVMSCSGIALGWLSDLIGKLGTECMGKGIEESFEGGPYRESLPFSEGCTGITPSNDMVN